MKRFSPTSALVFSLLLSGSAFAQEAQPAPQPAPAPQPVPQAAAPAPQGQVATQGDQGPLPALPSQQPQLVPQGQPQPAAQGQVVVEETPPPQAQWVYQYPTGQWVYTTDYGWIWVPLGATSAAVEGVPYTYIYSPSYGWNWYVSPWGWGGYRYGAWVAHPWHPVGWRGGWVAHPHVVVRLGGHYGGAHYVGHYGGYHGGGFHGGGFHGGGFHGGGGGHHR